jgi:RNA polymerase sigma-70 factor (ECF subfamily)
VRPLLEDLKELHAESFGWSLACCAWQRELAEDVLQEAYLRVLDGRARYAGRSSLRGWFFSVIKNVAAETRRGGTRRRRLGLRLAADGRDELADDRAAPSPERGLEADRSATRLRKALMQLPTRQREVMHLVFYAGCTLEEAAETLAMSLGSARTHYHRGKSRLAELLDLEHLHATDN